MRFFAGFLTASILCATLFICGWLYFGLPIDTNNNNDTETYTPPQEVQQQKYDDYVEDNPTVYSEGGYETKLHNEAGTNNYEYAKEHGLIKEDK